MGTISRRYLSRRADLRTMSLGSLTGRRHRRNGSRLRLLTYANLLPSRCPGRGARILSGGCGDSSTEREFPSDKVYRRDDRGVIGVESFCLYGSASSSSTPVLDARPGRTVPGFKALNNPPVLPCPCRLAWGHYWAMTGASGSGTSEDLQGWIDRLSHAAQVGEPLELAGSGSVDPADVQSWGLDRCIPAAALRHVLTCGELTVDPRGLRISGARFREELDLAHIAFPHPLHFKDCVFDSLADLRGAALKELLFEGCHTQQVALDGAEIGGGVFAEGLEADSEVCAVDAHIDGVLDLREAKLRNASGYALRLDRAEIGGGVFAEGLEADGEVRAVRAHI